MYKYYWVTHLTLVQWVPAVLQSSSWFVCLSSCTNTTECHLTLVQYCSLAPGLCVWVHVQILLSAIIWVHVQIPCVQYWVPSDPCAVLQSSSWFVCLSSCTNTTEFHLTLVQYCSLAPMYKSTEPSDCLVLLVCVSEFMQILLSAIWPLCLSSCTNTTECHLTLVQYCSSWFVCLSSCTNTTECHLTLVQYCSLAPGLCVWVHVQILLSAIWPLCSTAV